MSVLVFYKFVHISQPMTKQNITYKQAIVKAARLCSKGEKCTDDIREKLLQWGIEKQNISSIIEQLKKERFINDERYALLFAQSKVRQNKWGKIKIAYAMKQKNLPEDVINKSLKRIDDQEYKDILANVLQKKFHSLQDVEDAYTIKNKLIQYALNKGFENNIVHEAIASIIKKY